jgi:hypothetical protein
MSDVNNLIYLLASDDENTSAQQDDECSFGNIIQHLPEQQQFCIILEEPYPLPLPSLPLVKLVEPKTKSSNTEVLVGVIDDGAIERATPGARQISLVGKEAYYKVCCVVHNSVPKYYGTFISEDRSTVCKKNI